jgi:isopenicillin N synthase-like dioxygenase
MSDTLRKVPELSLLSYVRGNSTEQAQFVDKLFHGIKDYGFIILVDHTVDQKLCDKAYSIIHKYFSLPTEVKMKHICEAGGGQRGFTAFGTEHAKNNKAPDLKEFWHVGREVDDSHPFNKYYPKNIWPAEVPEFKETMSSLYASLDVTSGLILDALGQALDVPKSYFRDMIHLGNSILRCINYPPIPANADKNSIRAAAHEDINLITILMGATDSGLQLLDRDGSWLDVTTKPGQLVVDSGDMMARITNEVIPATTHRVINPDNSNSTRYSMPYFVHPNPEAMLSCIPSCVGSGEKYPSINSHEFLVQRLKEIGLLKTK